MTPAPSSKHQALQGQMNSWLDTHWAKPLGNQVLPAVNVASVGGWPEDYRIPDLVLLTPDRFAIDRDDYLEGAPTVVVEIRSPRDETIEKLPFYARLGVPEVWIIDRDTRAPRLLCLAGGEYQEIGQDAEGWLSSPGTEIRLRAAPGERLGIQRGSDTTTLRLLPEAPATR